MPAVRDLALGTAVGRDYVNSLTGQERRSDLPSRQKAIHFPSGDQAGRTSCCAEKVNCTGFASSDTLHIDMLCVLAGKGSRRTRSLRAVGRERRIILSAVKRGQRHDIQGGIA